MTDGVKRIDEEVIPVKDVTIRGINPELYRGVAELAKRLGISMGEVMNEAMKLLLDVRGVITGVQPLMEGIRDAGKALEKGISGLAPVVISGVEEIELNRSDFEGFGKRVLIADVKKLVLSQDVDDKTLEKYVALIRNCEEVSFPKSISKLLALSKCRGVSKVSFY